MFVNGNVVEFVSEPGSLYEVGAHIDRHGHEKVEGHLAIVIGD